MPWENVENTAEALKIKGFSLWKIEEKLLKSRGRFVDVLWITRRERASDADFSPPTELIFAALFPVKNKCLLKSPKNRRYWHKNLELTNYSYFGSVSLSVF